MKPSPAQNSIWSFLVDADARRADIYLLEEFNQSQGQWQGQPGAKTLTRSQIQRMMTDGRVTVQLPDGPHSLKAGDRLRKGTTVYIEFLPPEPSDLVPEDLSFEILYEDEHLVVVNKPRGLTVHPSSTQTQGTLVHALLFHIRNLSGIGGVLRPGIVHRIDKNTSGALVVTKTDEAHTKLAETFSQHAIQRTYWALCYGGPADPKWTRVESLIGRHEIDRKKMSMTVKQGRKAITHFRPLETYTQGGKPFASWIEATLETGRTHQIRVHLTGSGFSILGDPLYGKPSSRATKLLALPPKLIPSVESLSGQMLHARTLGFSHPITGRSIAVVAEPPEDFTHLLKELQNYRSKR